MTPIGLSRRDALGLCAGGVATALLGGAPTERGSEPRTKVGLGIAIYSFGQRQQAEKQRAPEADFFSPLGFLEHCHRLGAGGIQAPLGIRTPEETKALRGAAERDGLFIEGIIEPPLEPGSLERFEGEVRTAAAAGAGVLRTAIIPGRRYEYFDSLAAYRTAARRGREALERAEPVLRRHRLPLAVENHKDSRMPERLELLRQLSSEWIGACVDVGNSIALLEDSLEVVAGYAPWALSVHFKDQAVREEPDGFLFADVPLGRGFLELERMLTILRQAKPGVRLTLEMITREPLKVPCLTDKYWETMAEAPGADLARTLRLVRRHQPAAWPELAGLTLEQRVARETANVEASLAYAHERLGL